MKDKEFPEDVTAFLRELHIAPPHPDSFDTIQNIMDTIKEYREYIQPNPAAWDKYVLDVFQILGFNTKHELKRIISLLEMGSTRSRRAVVVLLRFDENIDEMVPDLSWSAFLFFAMHFFQVDWGILTDGQTLKIYNRNHNMKEIYLEVNFEAIITDNNFDDFFAFYNVASLIRGGPAIPVGKTGYQSKKQSKRIDLNYHLANKSNTVITLFDVLRAKIKSLSSQIGERINRMYIGYYTDNGFCQIQPQRDQLKIWINLDIHHVSDPHGLCRDVRNIGHHGMGKTEVNLRNFNDLDAVFDIIRQAYQNSTDHIHGHQKDTGHQSRHELRIKFWTELLEKAKQKTSLHANISPGKENWISTGAGKSGLGFAYVVRMDDAHVELYIDNGDRTWNKHTYEYFYQQKVDIERNFGDSLDWQLLNDKRASRIRYVIYDYGLKDQVYWSQLQELLIDGMIRLQHAFHPLITQMDYANVTRTVLNRIPTSQIQHKFEENKFAKNHTDEKEITAQLKKSRKHGRNSNPNKGSKLIVTLPDGRVFQEANAADTLIEVVEAVDIEKVYTLKLSLRGGPKYPVVSLSPVKNQNPHPSGKYFIHTHCSTDDKVRIINKIAKALSMDIKVDLLP